MNLTFERKRAGCYILRNSDLDDEKREYYSIEVFAIARGEWIAEAKWSSTIYSDTAPTLKTAKKFAAEMMREKMDDLRQPPVGDAAGSLISQFIDEQLAFLEDPEDGEGCNFQTPAGWVDAQELATELRRIQAELGF